MKTTIKNHLDELQVSNEKMLLYYSDNKMLISFFKDLKEKLIYLQQLVEMDCKYDWLEIENTISNLKEKDSELTNINVNFKIKEITTEKKEAFLTIKSL
jgi:glutaredoxin-related protein